LSRSSVWSEHPTDIRIDGGSSPSGTTNSFYFTFTHLMDIETLFDDVEDSLSESLEGSDVEIRKADQTLVFWKDGEHAGLEVPRSDIEQLLLYFKQKTEDDPFERVINKVKQDSFHYLVLKYL
jgi:hypothetical protein